VDAPSLFPPPREMSSQLLFFGRPAPLLFGLMKQPRCKLYSLRCPVADLTGTDYVLPGGSSQVAEGESPLRAGGISAPHLGLHVMSSSLFFSSYGFPLQKGTWLTSFVANIRFVLLPSPAGSSDGFFVVFILHAVLRRRVVQITPMLVL